ncbi:hypothetical protein RHGRI_019876 [Rhododendron griersonianum]|uniref:Uncharacterized protein n=1 Tax=Rhododendron griersonianum TaxID=479676 RepID=A0AAV6JJL6_9ERIC|nr:hypothetical protein RHGRI_019876 [Rhododendron griersonianum]
MNQKKKKNNSWILAAGSVSPASRDVGDWSTIGEHDWSTIGCGFCASQRVIASGDEWLNGGGGGGTATRIAIAVPDGGGRGINVHGGGGGIDVHGGDGCGTTGRGVAGGGAEIGGGVAGGEAETDGGVAGGGGAN